MRGESKIKFFVLLMAMIVVITSNGPMTFAAGEPDVTTELPVAEEDQTDRTDASDEEPAGTDEGQAEEDTKTAGPETEPEIKEQTAELENESSDARNTEINNVKSPSTTGDTKETDAEETENDEDDEENEEDEETEDAPEDNPPAPAEATFATLIKSKVIVYRGNDKTRSFTFRVGNDTGNDYLGHGICVYDKRNAAAKGSTGWIQEFSSSVMDHSSHYMDVMKLMYWGEYKDNTVSDAKTHLAIHRICTYWISGNDALRKWVSEDMGDKGKYAKSQGLDQYLNRSDAETEAAMKKDRFKVFVWYPQGAASKKQIAIFYRVMPPGRLTLEKAPADTGTPFIQAAPNNYNLAGAVYNLYSDSSCTVRASDISGKPVSFTTDANGKTGSVEIEPGTYWAKEVTASKGFLIDKNVQSRSYNVYSDTSTVVHSKEEPCYGIFSVNLIKQSNEYGYRRLLGTEFTLSYYDIDIGYGSNAPDVSVVSGKKPIRTWTFRTREGIDSEGKKVAMIDFSNDKPVSGGDMFRIGGQAVLPRGVFTLKETDPPVGVGADPNTYVGAVQQTSNGTQAVCRINGSDDLTVRLNNSSISLVDVDPEKNIVLKVRKIDAETGESVAQGTDREYSKGSLAGAEYEVYMEDPDYPDNVKVGTIITDENGYGELTKDNHRNGLPLMPGRYFIREVKAPPGYLADKYTTENKRDVFEDGQHIVVARIDDDDRQLIYNYEVISEEKSITPYFHKTDITGGCPELPGATLQVIDTDGNIIDQWVSTVTPHTIKAMPTGRYILREITAPYGYEQAEDAEFEIADNKVRQDIHMDNKPVIIRTTAVDINTGTHAGLYTERTAIKDTIRYENLKKGNRYRFYGTLMNKKTGKPITDKDGKEITARSEAFTADTPDGTVDIFFRFDSSLMEKGTAAVVFEKLYRVEDSDEDAEEQSDNDSNNTPGTGEILIAGHEDINDADQTVWYGQVIKTVAQEKSSLDHNLLAGPDAVISDTVTYEGLAAGEEYTITGELYDKTTQRLTGITAEATFRPASSSGTVIVLFRFDASDMGSHTLVAFEKLEHRSFEIDRHENPEDADQTIYIPEVKTKLGKLNEGVITDVVRYKNLIPGKTYTVSGYLMQKEDGRPVPDSSGNITFSPSAPDGEIRVELSSDRGHGKVVAFEYLYIIGEGGKKTLVGKHTDISDKEQTYAFPSTPKTGDENMMILFACIFVISSALLNFIMKRRSGSDR